ncbi:hypothetical protein [Campylobacter pinnipediorum]|uniref:hypothetical protein n=1 Tax=Campylobacter pinnipediorum TaxID=1965231 RepID=UPI00084D38EB|nr:hypothetical protein [Campylobacter pinnipediorum]AQW81528.1 hypothetical protein CPIN17260_1242 [Campylobacter pinnipediorum subsp. pinnipediorum]AQW83156.1 hypothetical protein CPIN17261_1155 [Campylobacter pinnipediorum subsp. pinnipediorum]
MKEFDLVSGLNFLLETLYYDAISTNNKILFDYDLSYPRVFVGEKERLIKTLEYSAKSLLYANTQSQIIISFKLTNYDRNRVFFRITINLNENNQSNNTLDKKNIQYLNKWIKYSDYEVIINNNKIILDIKLTLGSKRDSFYEFFHLNSHFEKSKKYHTLVAYENKDGFNILKNQLLSMDINIIQKNDYETFMKHMKDAIYKPNLIFLYQDFLTKKNIFEEIYKIQKIKNFSIIIICDNENKIDKKITKDSIILRQPYTYDSLIAILNLTQNKN